MPTVSIAKTAKFLKMRKRDIVFLLLTVVVPSSEPHFSAIEPLPVDAGEADTVAAPITSSSCRGESIPIQAFTTVPVLSTRSRVGVPDALSFSKGTPADV